MRLILLGPPGAGKTHLAQIWVAETGAALVPAADLAGADIPGLAAAGRVAVEDAASVAGNPQAEAALFHLHNLLAEHRLPLLLTAAAPPRDWGLGLPDLLSRMQGTAIARLEAPDDALLAAVLVKLFADRQLAVAPNLIPYLVARMPRSIGAARALVAALDAKALAARRPITRALAGEVLDRTEWP